MKIQVNAQTNEGVWGYMITVLDAAEHIVHSEWIATLPGVCYRCAGNPQGGCRDCG